MNVIGYSNGAAKRTLATLSDLGQISAFAENHPSERVRRLARIKIDTIRNPGKMPLDKAVSTLATLPAAKPGTAVDLFNLSLIHI